MGNTGFFYSSITKKIIMALAGLFLLTFLLVHLSLNLLILCDDDRKLFNIASHFMATNPVIQIFQVVLFGGFIVHMLVGVILQIHNWISRPVRYKVEGYSHTSVFSKFMIHTGIITLIFLVIHLGDFFVKAKFGHIASKSYDGHEYEDLGKLVLDKFELSGYVIFYVVALLILGFHLHHALQSAFQSLGLNHSRYNCFIKGLSTVLALVITIGFIIIPLVIYF